MSVSYSFSYCLRNLKSVIAHVAIGVARVNLESVWLYFVPNITKLNDDTSGGKAEGRLLKVGDRITEINGKQVTDLTHHGAERVISQTRDVLKMLVMRNSANIMRKLPDKIQGT